MKLLDAGSDSAPLPQPCKTPGVVLPQLDVLVAMKVGQGMVEPLRAWWFIIKVVKLTLKTIQVLKDGKKRIVM